MAQAAGVLDVFARNGEARGRPGYDRLRPVTSWPPARLERAERLAAAEVRPSPS